MFNKTLLPPSLNICLTGYKIPIQGRASDHGFLWPLAKGLAAAGHKVTVLSAKSPLGKAEIERDGVTAHYLYEGYPNYAHLKFEDAVHEKFHQLHTGESPFHLVHSIDASAYRIAKKKKQYKVCVAYDVDATQMSQIFSILGMRQDTLGGQLATALAVTYKFLTTYLSRDRKILASANGIFVTTPLQRIVLERYYLYPDFHTYNVPYGIDLGDLSPREETLNLKKELGLPTSSQVVVTLTDMTQAEETINLLYAFERVAVKKNNAYLVILGNGPKWRDIEFQVFNLALGGRVRMPGAIKSSSLSDYISISDVFVDMSSRTTGFETSVIEAMAQKKVIVGSEVSPIANIVEDGIDGFLLRPADVYSLSQLLLSLFSSHIDSQDIGEKARTKVLNIFDTNKMISGLIESYRRILLNSGWYHLNKKKTRLPRPKWAN